MSDAWPETSAWMWKLLGPLVLTVGYTTNVLTLVVLNRLKNKHPSHLYFKVLAVADFVFLVVKGLPAWIRYQFGVNLKDASLELCAADKMLGYSFGVLSRLMVAMVILQRAMQTYRGFTIFQHSPSVNSTEMTRVVVAFAVAFSFASNLYRPFVLTVRDGTCKYVEEYKRSGLVVMVWVEAIIFSYLPIAAMVGSIVYLHFSLKSRMSSTSILSRISRLTLAMIVMAATFILLDLPMTVWKLVHIVRPGLNSREHGKDVALFLVVCNSSIKFFLYVLIGPSFRKECKKLIVPKHKVAPQKSQETLLAHQDI